MDDQIPLRQVQKTVDRPRLDPLLSRRPADFRPPEQLVVAQHNQPFVRQPEAASDRADAELDLLPQRGIVLRQQLLEALASPLVMTGNQHPLVALDQIRQFLEGFPPRP